jgi:hypothetical protein
MMLRTPDQLHEYQKKAVNFQCSKPASMLWLDMGLGKTVITLTSISHLLSTGFLRGVIIVAPIRVIRLVWRQEAAKWGHTNHLRFSMVTGTKDQRTRALMRPADVYLINYECLGWLADTLQTYFVSKDRPIPFNGLVWDEISKCKNSSTQRVKSIRKVLDHFDWTTGLTGTPASNGYKDLHGQYLVVDKGHRLGTSKTAFRTRFYKKEGPYKEVPYPDTEEVIKNLVGDITLEMSAEDYNPLPNLIVNDIEVEMPEELRARYNQMEKDFFLQLDNGQSKEMFNQASLTNACLQFANGAIYPIAGMPLWEPLHDLKLDALEELVDEANGEPILCSYAYRSDAERIMTRFKSIDPINLTECKSEKALNDAMRRWTEGSCRLMIGHPACLHPETQVLTERRGWVKIIDVMADERVHDGVEFVHHDGCSYSGFRDVIDVFGITMTPTHKLLISGQWVEAQNVRDSGYSRNDAMFQRETVFAMSSEVPEMRDNSSDVSTERSKKQPSKTGTLFSMYQRNIPSNDQHSDMDYLARYEVASAGHERQELRRSRYNHVPYLGGLYGLLSGHVSYIRGWIDDRTHRREQTVRQRELSMGYEHGAAKQQAKQSLCDLLRGKNTSCGTLSENRVFQNDVGHAIEQGNDGGRGSGKLSPIRLRQEPTPSEYKKETKAHVYDLVNCGPRHRFLIRNQEGEMFISHNSMGHGVDGLQSRGHTLVWFGLTWSLDLFDQFNARLRRQGQGVPVICHRIMMQDTLDQAQALALEDKAQTQQGLRNAIKTYRQSRNL